MRTITSGVTNLVLAFIFIAVSTTFSNKVQAQETERGFILSTTEFIIKPGHNNQFREGLRAWKGCYIDNGGDWTWSTWDRIKGEGNVYILTSAMDSWAKMDETDDQAAMNCRYVVRDLINPHIESTKEAFPGSSPNSSIHIPTVNLYYGYSIGM